MYYFKYFISLNIYLEKEVNECKSEIPLFCFKSKRKKQKVKEEKSQKRNRKHMNEWTACYVRIFS